jgi:hypothetical protein
MEAIVTKDLWTWHVFIGLPSSWNDINVVDCSPLMVNYLHGVAHVEFTMNNHAHHICYLLANGIYPNWAIFQKTISKSEGEKQKWFTKM